VGDADGDLFDGGGVAGGDVGEPFRFLGDAVDAVVELLDAGDEAGGVGVQGS